MATKKKKPKCCDCAASVSTLLAPQGAEVVVSYSFSTGACRTYVVTEKVDPSSRKKLVPLIATYCPFCGVIYPGAERTTLTKGSTR